MVGTSSDPQYATRVLNVYANSKCHQNLCILRRQHTGSEEAPDRELKYLGSVKGMRMCASEIYFNPYPAE